MFKLFFISLFSFFTFVNALTIKDSKGEFSINYIPKRIVALEFSFVDALALVDVKPIGIADDNKPERILPIIKEKIGTYTSVGTRSQPSLELIASLKPDLIIADIKRHSTVYEALKKIAPTIILPSKRISYKQLKEVAQKIGKIIGKEEQMHKRLIQHETYMNKIASKVQNKGFIQVAKAKDTAMFLNSDDSYIAEVVKRVNLPYSKSFKDNNAPRYASLEQLLAINPDYLILAEDIKPSIIETYKNKPLWKDLKCSKKGHIIKVDNPNLLSRSRGIFSTEEFANILLKNFAKSENK